MQLEAFRFEGCNKTNENALKCIKKNGLSGKSEVYEKVKTKLFCILICKLHRVSQSRFSFDPLWGGANLSFGYCENITACGEERPQQSFVVVRM